MRFVVADTCSVCTWFFFVFVFYCLLHFVCRHVCNLVPTWEVGKQNEQLKSFPVTKGAYIFNLLSFTYCLNDSCNFNESLSANDTATTIPMLKTRLAALDACLMLVASLI